MTLPPTTSDISEMDRFKRILEGDRSESTKPAPQILPNGEEAIILSKTPTSKDIGQMANIMKSFASTTGVKSFRDLHDAGGKAVSTLVENSQIIRPLKEALITEKTENGIKIGAWEITKSLRESLTKKKETVYHIRNANTGETIKASFLIIESVQAIIRLLNNGAVMSNPKIREIAELEIKYRRLRERALKEKRYWQRAEKAGNEFKMDLYEAKFAAAKANALYTKERIRNIYYQL